MVGRIVVQMLSVCLFFLFIAGCHHVVKEDEWVEESLDKARKQSLMMARKIDNLRGKYRICTKNKRKFRTYAID